jgi:leucyl/phenylalanyl-tRNA--protein transferase
MLHRVHGPVPLPIVEPDLLMLAYRGGVFPMSDARDDPDIYWIEPRIRAILPLDGFRLSRSLARTLRRGKFTVTCNRAFARVIEECAAPRDEEDGSSWISHRIQASYEEVHRLGHAHSIECWQTDDEGTEILAGGLYGIGFDRVFCGESMFSRASDASKVALAWLVAALRRAGAMLLDCQFQTPHLQSLGAVEISQRRYLTMLKAALTAHANGPGQGGTGRTRIALSLPEGFTALLEDAAAAGFHSSPGKFIAQSLTQTS